MGTNYYRAKLLSDSDKNQITEILKTSPSLRDFIERIEEKLGNNQEKVHICKVSYGYSPGFDHNWGVYYEPTREGLEKFLNEDDTYVVDEYGEVMSNQDFWNMIDEINSRPDLIRTYSTRDCIYLRDDINRCRDQFGVTVEEGYIDFISKDGLRFNVFSDFC